MRTVVLTSLLWVAGCASGSAPAALNQLSPAEETEGWDLLFDGQTLDGWTNRGTAEWHVEDGTITVTPGMGGGHLATERSFADFRLQLDFFVDEESNSGVYVRAPEDEPATVDNAYEVQIFDDGPQWQTGELIQVQENDEVPHTVNQWNHLDIAVVDFHFTVYLNGRMTVDADAPPRLREGVIILAPPRGELRFRNIRIQEL